MSDDDTFEPIELSLLNFEHQPLPVAGSGVCGVLVRDELELDVELIGEAFQAGRAGLLEVLVTLRWGEHGGAIGSGTQRIPIVPPWQIISTFFMGVSFRSGVSLREVGFLGSTGVQEGA